MILRYSHVNLEPGSFSSMHGPRLNDGSIGVEMGYAMHRDIATDASTLVIECTRGAQAGQVKHVPWVRVKEASIYETEAERAARVERVLADRALAVAASGKPGAGFPGQKGKAKGDAPT